MAEVRINGLYSHHMYRDVVDIIEQVGLVGVLWWDGWGMWNVFLNAIAEKVFFFGCWGGKN